MRKLALAVIAGVVLGAVGVVASASSPTPKVEVARTAGFSAASPAHPQGVKLAVSLGWQGLNPADQPTVTKIDVWFPKGTHYNGAKFKQCSLRVLDAVGPRGCPKASITTTAPPAGIKIVTTFGNGAKISNLALVSDV